MPLIILGALLIIAIIAYWYVTNRESDDPVTPEKIRERYADAFEGKAKDIARDVSDDVKKAIRKRAGIFDADYDVEDDGYGERKSSDKDTDDNSIPFPSDVEREKNKRGIH